MLGFIKRYRNDPKRTVITVKTKRSFYVLKRKDIVNCALENASLGAVNKVENKHDLSPENDTCFCDSYALEHDKPDTNEAHFAFKAEENIGSLDACRKVIKLKEKRSKGAFVCEKSYRILLCDLVAAALVVLSVACLTSRLIKKIEKK